MLKICYVRITVIKIINILLQLCEAKRVHTLLYVAEVAIQQHICDNLLSLVHIAVNLMFAPASGVEPLMLFSLGHSPAQDSPVMPILLTVLLIYPRSVYSHLWPRPFRHQRMLMPFSSTVIISTSIASVGSSLVTVIFSLPSCLVSVTVFGFVSLYMQYVCS